MAPFESQGTLPTVVGEHSLPTQCKLGSPWQVPFVLSHGVPRKLAALSARAFTEPWRRGDGSRVALRVEEEIGPPAPVYHLSDITGLWSPPTGVGSWLPQLTERGRRSPAAGGISLSVLSLQRW